MRRAILGGATGSTKHHFWLPKTTTIANNHEAMPGGSPTSKEREEADAELKAKEAEEQAKLPYKWTQTIKDVDVTIAIDGKYKGRDLDVKLSKTGLRVAIKGQDPIIDVSLLGSHAHVAKLVI
jgi:hypothetical protein